MKKIKEIENTDGRCAEIYKDITRHCFTVVTYTPDDDDTTTDYPDLDSAETAAENYCFGNTNTVDSGVVVLHPVVDKSQD